MTTNLLKEGDSTGNLAETGTVTRRMVRERAVELAVIDGRPAQDASKTDWEQAKRELTREPRTDPNEEVVEVVDQPSIDCADPRKLSDR